jgi:hypothetical protein
MLVMNVLALALSLWLVRSTHDQYRRGAATKS